MRHTCSCEGTLQRAFQKEVKGSDSAMAAESDFLAENNQCGQTLLKLVSRGNAIVAELLRLSDFVPPLFKLESKEDREKYGELLPDFSYFRAIDLFEHRLNSRPVSCVLSFQVL